MNKKFIVYISTNDGTDTRINKEVRTLSKVYNVIFIGVVEKNSKESFVDPYCYSCHLINGRRNHPLTILKQILTYLRLVFCFKIYSVHIVNEQLMVFFWPLLFFRHTVVDVFDSLFMRYGIKKNSWLPLKRLVYAPCDKVIVTDDERFALMPSFLMSRLVVLPNYPYRYNGPLFPSSKVSKLNILFIGWLGMNRGGNIAKGLLDADERVNLIMFGWFSDEKCKTLANHPRAEYKGVVSQQQVLEFAATQGDYILCLYETLNNFNMKYASPNKIYDGIQTCTPLLINKEVKISTLVKKLNLGIVLPSYYHNDFKGLVKELFDKKNSFEFAPEIRETYTWENIEERLLTAHLR